METKKKTNYFKIILIFLLLIFTVTLILNKSGYYEAKMAKKTEITEIAIKEFEEDIAEGKEIDIGSYIDITEKDYSNFFTKSSDKINEQVIAFLNNGFSEAIDLIKYLFF